eukprot:CAMPEP_0202915718 /NCGR_PEP_ID=MMETSP1392-20130828/66448_1 /ASSEMBLY_ACC=CAM_ASM_000868 /TAXON_ID=225041 /ORGANISM="Chlamydomonas chlamydogama, Strain SAG 11-48b" /LENGTH=271 /DNA_ID=CAMNT_0049607855 /DNA_START=118 /DNA_END=933 /DNA_ORIENTATION=-
MSNTKHTVHGSTGKTRLRKSFVEKPDTLIHLPDGQTLTLRRKEGQEVMPLFRKFNPKKFDPNSGKARGKGSSSSNPTLIPFSRLFVTAALAYQAFSFIKERFWNRRKRQQQRLQEQQQQLALYPWDELPEEEEEAAEARRQAQERAAQRISLAPAMLRNALPKPKRRNLAAQQAEMHRARPRQHTTSKQMMRPSNAVRPRSKGTLEKWDEAVQAQLRATVAQAARQQLALKQQQQIGAAPAAALPALPAPPAAAAAGAVAAASSGNAAHAT